ncbi:serine protease [Pseudonocardiaceae bacterium YIM PH 21723]|nr:serine protease [Pseudonocardiaceae bacterium YIM PH 21723]
MFTVKRALMALGGALLVAAAVVPATGLLSVGEVAIPKPIVGGNRASTAQFPFVVDISRNGGQWCGGTLVAADKVATAAHCFAGVNASEFTVFQGRDDRQSTAGKSSKVAKVFQDPGFQGVESGNDYAVLTLATPFTGVQVLPLASASDSGLYTPGTNATVLGWGKTAENGQSSRFLLKVDVPLRSAADCSRAYAQSAGDNTQVCAGFDTAGKDSCGGDSGGPLVAGGKLIGIVSYG